MIDFATDTDISGGAFRKERELQPWMPDTELSDTFDLDNKTGSGWDQFKVNKDLFGVDTDYDENYYTTTLDKSSEFYKLKIREAARIADEIEKRPTTNVHILEERGFRVESELDEEEKYSSVIRQQAASTTNATTGKYVPPQRRGQADKNNTSAPASTSKKDDILSKLGMEESASIPIPATGSLQHSSSSLERTDSFEELGGGSSKGSPTMSPSRSDHSQLAQERLKLRMLIVNERLKNSAPVVTNQDNISRSPLLSPLIGDPRSVNALSLEPSTPKVDENVYKEFFDFSLNSKKQDSKREKTIAEWKTFSKGLDKKGVKITTPPNTPPNSIASPTATTTPPTAAPAITSPTKATDKEKNTTTTTPNSKLEKTATKSTLNTEGSTSTTTTTPASTETSTAASKETQAAKSKLNPNAKVFKPSSTSHSVAQPVVATGGYMYGYPADSEEYMSVHGAMYPGYPPYAPRGAIYPNPSFVPTQPILPTQPIYPNGAPVRMSMVGQPGYPVSYPYQIYNQPGSPQMYPPRVMVPGNPAFYPPQQQPPRSTYPLGILYMYVCLRY
jgi:hypothetical protein